jgi:hypothetical protein
MNLICTPLSQWWSYFLAAWYTWLSQRNLSHWYFFEAKKIIRDKDGKRVNSLRKHKTGRAYNKYHSVLLYVEATEVNLNVEWWLLEIWKDMGRGRVEKRKVGFNHGTLYACMEISSWIPLIYIYIYAHILYVYVIYIIIYYIYIIYILHVNKIF